MSDHYKDMHAGIEMSLEVVNQVSKRAHENTYVNQLKKSYKKNIKTVCPSEEKGKGKKEQPCACPLDCQ